MLEVVLATDASGAAEAARRGHVVVVVDIIDMSTALESALDEGALAVFGASPDGADPPVPVDPEKIGNMAGKTARLAGTDVILISEPRAGGDKERIRNARKAISGIERAGARVIEILPNIGAEVACLADLKGLVVIAITGSGGVAFDAAVTAGAPDVLTGTVARTMRKKGPVPARDSARRAVEAARRLKTGITVVAASGNSVEDVLAARYIHELIETSPLP